jgi:hypothetical protein
VQQAVQTAEDIGASATDGVNNATNEVGGNITVISKQRTFTYGTMFASNKKNCV